MQKVERDQELEEQVLDEDNSEHLQVEDKFVTHTEYVIAGDNEGEQSVIETEECQESYSLTQREDVHSSGHCHRLLHVPPLPVGPDGANKNDEDQHVLQNQIAVSQYQGILVNLLTEGFKNNSRPTYCK